MGTELGAGRNFMRDFAADFAASDVYIGGKTFPKGYFTVAALNHGKSLRTKLLYAGLPIQDALIQMENKAFSPETYDKAVAAVLEIHESLSAVEPFCYLDIMTEIDLLDAVMSEDSKQSMIDCYGVAAKHFYTNDPASIHLSSEEENTLEKGLYIHQCLKQVFTCYFYFCHDLVNFCSAIFLLEDTELRNLKVRSESEYAKACQRYFSKPEVMFCLYMLQPSVSVAGFELTAKSSMEMIVIPNPKAEGEMMFARRFYFRRVMDFLTMDFFEGLHAGHSPKAV